MIMSSQHAHALELLKEQLAPGKKALDVGSGSGYLTACFALMVILLIMLVCITVQRPASI